MREDELDNLLDLISICHVCKRELNDGEIYLKHPKYGIVCEHCPEFSDGGIAPVIDED